MLLPRPRSKTFEEYEKETSELWDDKEEDLDRLTHSTELETVPEAVVGGASEGVAPTLGTTASHPTTTTNSRAKSKGQYSQWAWQYEWDGVWHHEWVWHQVLCACVLGVPGDLKTFFTGCGQEQSLPHPAPPWHLRSLKVKNKGP